MITYTHVEGPAITYKNLTEQQRCIIMSFSLTDSDLQSRLLHYVEQTKTTIPSDSKTVQLGSILQDIATADMTVCASLIQYLCVKHGNPVPGCLQDYIDEGRHGKEMETVTQGELKTVSFLSFIV